MFEVSPGGVEAKLLKDADNMTDDQWYAWMRYFCGTLINNQLLVLQLMTRRAAAQVSEQERMPRGLGKPPVQTVGQRLAEILKTLDLQIVVQR